MKINIDTKFNINQEVYICRKTIHFVNGQYKDIIVPDYRKRVVTCILTEYYKTYNTIEYCLDGGIPIPENLIFASIVDAENYCKSNE